MSGVTSLDLAAIRAQFPILSQRPYGKDLVYFDSAATSQKPQAVIDAVVRHYTEDNANIHRAVYQLGQRSTAHYEAARVSVAQALRAPSEREIIFTRGATEAINLVAYAFLAPRLRAGDEILVSAIEHHANVVPWQLVAQRVGATVRAIPLDERGDLDLAAFERMLGPRTRMVALVHTSNALGTQLPVAEVGARCQALGVPFLVDGAQAIAHGPTDVHALNADFYVLSGHKVYAPTGIGALWGRFALLEQMEPWQGGGDMIEQVSFEGSTFAPPPARFEAGTPAIAQAVGLGAAFDWLAQFDPQAIVAHEDLLTQATLEGLAQIPKVRVIGGTPSRRGPAISFVVEGLPAHDLALMLDKYGICVRVGHHCAQPAMAAFGVEATARASFAIYNTLDEVGFFLDRVRHLVQRFT